MNFNFIKTLKSKLKTKADLKDWEQKYDVSINILKEEYLLRISSIKNIDEKANKIIVVFSLIFTIWIASVGQFISQIQFNSDCIKFIHLLYIAIVLLYVTSLVFAFRTIFSINSCLELIESYRMPNMNTFLKDTGNHNIITFKKAIINNYQEAITKMGESISIKQMKLKRLQSNIKYFTSLAIICITFTMLISILGKPS